jgi:hypothetical protein
VALQFITCCLNSTADAIIEMTDQAVQVSYRTALKRIGKAALAREFPTYDWGRRPHDLTMKRDWHVGYYRSVYLGQPVYYVKWSAIEFIFGDPSHGTV